MKGILTPIRTSNQDGPSATPTTTIHVHFKRERRRYMQMLPNQNVKNTEKMRGIRVKHVQAIVACAKQRHRNSQADNKYFMI
eukprot:1360509-Amphidinium_carterae.1